jgi:feruloyl esterase
VTHLQGAQVWNATVVHKTEAAYVPPAKYPLIHNAVVAACDSIDGVQDGVLEDPRRCKYDPSELLCKGSDAPTCLTAPQVEAVRKTYAGMTNRSGQPLFPGLERGSEAGWNTLMAPQPMSLAVETYKYIVHKDAKWDYLTFDPDSDVALADKTVASQVNSTDPNLKKFFDRGGKLLMYHGWSDPGIAPQNSVNYYQSVVDKLGGTAKTSNSIRLFMVPGMGHCRGGDGTDTFDTISMLNAWVANGKAPDRIEASRVRDGKTDRTRPLCPYPQTAQYQGSGSTDESQNFACRMP